MRYKVFLLALWLGAAVPGTQSAPRRETLPFVEAPYQCKVLKHKETGKRFRDFKTSEAFIIYKIEFTNRDKTEHRVDYACFCLTDSDGCEYEVHQDATIVKQTEFEDLTFKDLNNFGFSHQTTKPKFKISGWLVFEVPDAAGPYQLKFRGYLP